MRWVGNSLCIVRYDSGNYGVVVPRRAGNGLTIINAHYLYVPEEVEHVTCESNAECTAPDRAVPR